MTGKNCRSGMCWAGATITHFVDGYPFDIDGPIELCPHCDQQVPAEYTHQVDNMHEWCREEVEAKKAEHEYELARDRELYGPDRDDEIE